MPVITRSDAGKVTATSGDEQSLGVGDLVEPEDVIPDTQQGIVRSSDEADPAAATKTTKTSDTDRVISGLNQGDLDVAPDAGLVNGGSQVLWLASRVERVSEFVAPASIALPQYDNGQDEESTNNEFFIIACLLILSF
jgi:hypothetical protein